jgi:hypothetical protein
MSTGQHEQHVSTVEHDIVPRAAFWVTVGVAVVVIVASLFVAEGLLRSWAGRVPLLSAPPRPAPPEIGIVEQTLILDTRRGLDEKVRQRESLLRYGWVDAQHHVARIPIDRAMDLVTDAEFMHRAFVRKGEP